MSQTCIFDHDTGNYPWLMTLEYFAFLPILLAVIVFYKNCKGSRLIFVFITVTLILVSDVAMIVFDSIFVC